MKCVEGDRVIYGINIDTHNEHINPIVGTVIDASDSQSIRVLWDDEFDGVPKKLNKWCGELRIATDTEIKRSKIICNQRKVNLNTILGETK